MAVGLSSALRLISRLATCSAVLVILALPALTAQARTAQTIMTPSGISAWLIEDHGIPLVALSFAIRGGSVEDPSGKEGAGHMLTSMMDEGAGQLDADAFKGRLEALGSEISFSISHSALNGSLLSLSKNLDESARLLKLALQHPNLKAEDFEGVTQQEIASLAFVNRNARRAAIQQFNASAFAGHPYGHPVTGTSETLSRLTIEDIRARRERLISRTGLHVVIVGALNSEQAKVLIDRVFADLPEGDKTDPIKPIALQLFRKTVPALPGHAEETAIFALPMPDLDDQDFFPAMVLNYIVGSGNFDAHLVNEIRVKRGLTYSISSQLLADRASSISLGIVSTEAGKMDEAIDVMNSVFAKFAATGPTTIELENAKSGLNGAYLLALNTSLKLADHLLGLWIDGLGADYMVKRQQKLNAVTLADARRVAKTLYNPNALSLLIMQRKKRAE